MCGIGGVKRYGTEPITADAIRALAVRLEYRGKDATGLALYNPGKGLAVFKQAMPAFKFMSDRDTLRFLHEYLLPDTDTVLIHTRSWTTGVPSESGNNHPVFSGNTAIVHNGMISNHEFLFKDLNLKRSADVDTDILRAILDKEGISPAGIKLMRRATGSAAIAAISVKQPGYLLLARCGSPLVLAATDHHLIWASDKDAIHGSYRPYGRKWGLPMLKARSDLYFMPMQDDSAYIFGPDPKVEEDGSLNPLEYHDEFPLGRYSVRTRYNACQDYAAHRVKYLTSGENPNEVQCRNPECGFWVVLPPKAVELASFRGSPPPGRR